MVELTVKSWGAWLRGRWAEVYWPRPLDLLQGLKEALELQGRFSGPSKWMAWRSEAEDGLTKSILTIYATLAPYIIIRFERVDESIEFLVPVDIVEEMIRILEACQSHELAESASS